MLISVQSRIFQLIGCLAKDYPDCIENDAGDGVEIRDIVLQSARKSCYQPTRSNRLIFRISHFLALDSRHVYIQVDAFQFKYQLHSSAILYAYLKSCHTSHVL